jgi:hypothetical protein
MHFKTDGGNSLDKLDGESPKPSRRGAASRTARVTRDPTPRAPSLICPHCDCPLRYQQTIYGGVKPEERWDYFDCRTCGSFVYRDRTRKLRRS